MKRSTDKRDIHQEVTDKMLALLEAGNLPWVQPWKNKAGVADGMLPYNAVSRNNYQGINIALLWAASKHYGRNAWVTYKQATELGGNVKKGEKAELVVFYKRLQVKDKNDPTETVSIPMLRHYHVFNVEQCENLRLPELKPVEAPASPRGAVLAIAQAHNVSLAHGGNKAYFRPSTDDVQMPHFDQFASEEAYSATLAHELTHWTGHKSRLARDLSGMFGNEKYAREELVAEMGSAFLCAELGLQYEERHHAAYLKSWISALRNDKKFIFQAAAQASKAVNYLQKRLPEQTEEAADEVLSDEQVALNKIKVAETLALLA